LWLGKRKKKGFAGPDLIRHAGFRPAKVGERTGAGGGEKSIGSNKAREETTRMKPGRKDFSTNREKENGPDPWVQKNPNQGGGKKG